MSKGNETWVRFVMKVALLGVVVMVAAFAGNRLANARPGVAGGTARTFVTVAGSITGLTGTQSATFHFRRRGVMTDLCAPRVDIVIGTGGAFAVEVPLDETATRCPETMFDGSDVVVDVDLPGRSAIVRDANINPVPYAVYAQQYGTPDCPVGYQRERTAVPAGAIVCTRILSSGSGGNVDYVVRVGNGPSAFWIDQYESSVWSSYEGAAPQRFDSEGNGGFGSNGQWATGMSPGSTPPAFAISRAGASPARWITWFQAQVACRASGKRLPNGEEWLAAAQGTTDPGANNGAGNANCNTNGGIRLAPDRGNGCISVWGAQDMIGNVWEFTSEWYAGLGTSRSATPLGPLGEGRHVSWPMMGPFGWPSQYNNDSTAGITSGVLNAGGEFQYGVPAVAMRGGGYASTTGAGVFALRVDYGPFYGDAGTGFRCVIPR